MKRSITIAGKIFVMTFAATAADEVPKFEVSADYSFAHFDPARNFFKTKNLNGGGGAFTLNFGDFFGIKRGQTESRFARSSGI